MMKSNGMEAMALGISALQYIQQHGNINMKSDTKDVTKGDTMKENNSNQTGNDNNSRTKSA